MTGRTPQLAPRSLGSDRGVAAVEFALILPLLVVMLFAITAFGIGLSRFVAYVGAAREGARYAAVHCAPEAERCTDGLIRSRVEEAAAGSPIGPTSPTADRDCTVAAGQVVTVSWQQSIPIQVPLLPDLSRTVTIRGSFRCE